MKQLLPLPHFACDTMPTCIFELHLILGPRSCQKQVFNPSQILWNCAGVPGMSLLSRSINRRTDLAMYKFTRRLMGNNRGEENEDSLLAYYHFLVVCWFSLSKAATRTIEE